MRRTPRSFPPILLVEDNDDVREIYAMLFEMHGYDVRQAGSATDAIVQMDTLQTAPIVITDLTLPDMHVADMCRALRAHRTGPPVGVIGITGWSLERVLEDRRNHDCFDRLFRKPVEPSTLLDAVGSFTA